MKIELEIRWKLGVETEEMVDPVLFRLLDGIRDGGSLRSAAAASGVSYRHAWGLLERWENLLGKPLATLSRGRGAELTPLGEKLLWAQNRLETRLGPDLESLSSEIGSELDTLLSDEEPPPLRIFASHGLALGVLRRLATEHSGLKLDLQFRGSLESLRLLKARQCDIAGFHVATGEVGEQLKPRFRPWLQRQYVLVHVVTRTQGLMLAAGNPKNIRGLGDLIRNGIRFVNRQPASGTRLLFDQLLENAAVPVDKISGYDTEEFTHLAVAAMVASGSADAGFGIAAAAAGMNLDFLPLVNENYYFCLPRTLRESSAVQSLLSLLHGREFRDAVNDLSGYDAGSAGDIVSIDNFLAAGR